jgi:hypothetical protein
VVFTLLLHSLFAVVSAAHPPTRVESTDYLAGFAQLRATLTVILIFFQGYVARLAPLEYQELLLTLEEEPRRKIWAKTRRLRRGLANQLDHAGSP